MQLDEIKVYTCGTITAIYAINLSSLNISSLLLFLIIVIYSFFCIGTS